MHVPANSIWLWGQGKKPTFPPSARNTGSGGAVVAAVDLVKGIGALAGFETPAIERGDRVSRYRLRCQGPESGLELLDLHDIVYVHVEAPDEASHAGSLPEKIKAIEQIDEKFVGYLLERIGSDVRLLIATDHATPALHEDPLRVPRTVRCLSKRGKGKVREAPTMSGCAGGCLPASR